MNSGEIFAAARAAGVTIIRLAIFQPAAGGMREHVISLDDLEQFAEYARQKESTAEGAVLMRDKLPDDEWQRIYLHPEPNADDCAYCKAMAECPAYAARVETEVGVSIPDIEAFGVPVPTEPTTLSSKLKAAPLLEAWCMAVRAEAERQMLAGGSVPGFGLELGRQGNRDWANPADVEQVLRKQMRLSIEDVYNLKLKSPTQVEKLTKGSDAVIGPRQWTKLQATITRADPKPSVKPIGAIKVPFVPPAQSADAFPQVDDLG